MRAVIGYLCIRIQGWDELEAFDCREFWAPPRSVRTVVPDAISSVAPQGRSQCQVNFGRPLKSGCGFKVLTFSVPVGRRELRRRSSDPSPSTERESTFFGWDPATFPPALLAPRHYRSGSFLTGRARTPIEVPAFSPRPKAAARGTPRKRPNAQAGDFRLPFFCRRVETPAKCFVEHADRRRVLMKTVAFAP
jgi:hypothetical protein